MLNLLTQWLSGARSWLSRMFYWSQILSTEYRDNNTRTRVTTRWKYKIEWFLVWQLFPAIIVTGSTCIEWTCNGQSVEVLKDDGTSLCTLPDLPDERTYHTQSGLVICGGYRTMTSCYKFSSGVWTESHSLLHHRWIFHETRSKTSKFCLIHKSPF